MKNFKYYCYSDYLVDWNFSVTKFLYEKMKQFSVSKCIKNKNMIMWPGVCNIMLRQNYHAIQVSNYCISLILQSPDDKWF